jgi:hypothetical protein
LTSTTRRASTTGVAFFSREKLLVDNQPVPLPARCDAIFVVIDTASKTGTDNDATAVTFFAYDTLGRISLFILDWDVVQIEGAMLETWLPQVFARLEELARLCRARGGSIGAFIEDQELRDDSPAASSATTNACAPDRLEAHRDGQGRARDFGVRLCPS